MADIHPSIRVEIDRSAGGVQKVAFDLFSFFLQKQTACRKHPILISLPDCSHWNTRCQWLPSLIHTCAKLKRVRSCRGDVRGSKRQGCGPSRGKNHPLFLFSRGGEWDEEAKQPERKKIRNLAIEICRLYLPCCASNLAVARSTCTRSRSIDAIISIIWAVCACSGRAAADSRPSC